MIQFPDKPPQDLKKIKNSSVLLDKQLSNFACPGQVLVASSLLSWEYNLRGTFPIGKAEMKLARKICLS